MSVNPLLTRSTLPYEAFDFPSIKVEHFEPAIMQGMAEQVSEIDNIANSSDAPTFTNTVEALESSGELFSRATSIFYNLANSDSNEPVRAIEDTLAPLVSQHSDNIFLNEKLFNRVETIYNQREALKLEGEELRLLEYYYKKFVRSGARLSEEQKQTLRSLNEQHSVLTNKFSQNLIKMDEGLGVFVSDVKLLDGLSEAEIATAKAMCEERRPGEEGYLLTLVNTTRNPLLASLKNRELRRELWELSSSRGSCVNGKYTSDNNDDIDQGALIKQLITLRAQKSKLLGFDNYASLALEEEMAKTPETVSTMLKSMVGAVMNNVNKEQDKIRQVMADDLGVAVGDVVVEPWDWEYYCEKVRLLDYDLDEQQLKPYFEFNNVINHAVFKTLNRLYGITFKPREDIPVYHPDVKAYEVFDEQDKPFALFYADYFKRQGKQGGAWMNNFRPQANFLPKGVVADEYHGKPIVVNVMNIHKATSGSTLLSSDDITTALHEVGHGLHGMLSACKYESLAGTSVSTDAVEVPSQAHEDFAFNKTVLNDYARHHETNEPIPQDLLDKLLATRCFNQGFDTLEYLSAALIDLEWHLLTEDQVNQVFSVENSVDAFEQQVLAKYGLTHRAVAPRYKSRYFSHSLGGGYSAKYYAYIYSEIYSADAFKHIQDSIDAGGNAPAKWREMGDKFRSEVLSRGDTREFDKGYAVFRGHTPTTDALLERRGLKN